LNVGVKFRCYCELVTKLMLFAITSGSYIYSAATANLWSPFNIPLLGVSLLDVRSISYPSW